MKSHYAPPPSPIISESARTLSSPNEAFYHGMKSTDRAPREEILHRAYAIWESEGCPVDRKLQNWLQAEAEVVGRT